MFIKNRLEKVLSECADNTALAYDNYKITYKQIDEMSDFLVEILKKNDICTGSTILILNDKSWHFFALMVACLKQRITYCNLDPTLSKARLKYITDLTDAELVVTKIDLENLISDGSSLNKNLVKKAVTNARGFKVKGFNVGSHGVDIAKYGGYYILPAAIGDTVVSGQANETIGDIFGKEEGNWIQKKC